MYRRRRKTMTHYPGSITIRLPIVSIIAAVRCLKHSAIILLDEYYDAMEEDIDREDIESKFKKFETCNRAIQQLCDALPREVNEEDLAPIANNWLFEDEEAE